MRKLAVIMAMALVLCGALAMSAQGTLLTPGTLADYIALGHTGGTIDDKLFFDFTYSGTASGGATAIPASGIGVTPHNDPLNPGLEFQAAWTAGAGQTLDSLIKYKVQVLPGGNAIKDVSASMDGFGFSDGGIVAVAETVNLGATLLANLFLHADTTGIVNFASATFDPTPGILDVVKDISVNGNLGTASVSDVTNRFSEVPVPPTAILLGSGLLGLVGFRFRKNQA